jgi:3,4-dihydroxy 2-butanone 4-phosphate synthase/GTP cyclohydrolase II
MNTIDQIKNIDLALEDIKNGKMVIVVDDEDRENEGDFIIPADKATPQDINFMMKHARGLICIAITQERSEELKLDPMVNLNTSLHETNFTVSVDAKKNITTGISATDRWETLKTINDIDASPSDLARPGHMFPLIAKSGGVLRRAGHTEASIDLAKLAGFSSCSLLVEIVDEDGSMARLDRLKEISKEHDLRLISIAELIEYRRKKDKLITELLDIPFPNEYGEFKLRLFEDSIHRDHHVALIKGEITEDDEVLVRVHSQCLTGDIFGSLRCDCGPQLEESMKKIDSYGKGVLVYLRQEGRGIGLKNKLLAYQLQDSGLDTVEANEKLGYGADLREYGIGAQILRECNVRQMRLLTNNPRKIIGLEEGYGLKIVKREPIEIKSNCVNRSYLKAKRDKLGHFLSVDKDEEH